MTLPRRRLAALGLAAIVVSACSGQGSERSDPVSGPSSDPAATSTSTSTTIPSCRREQLDGGPVVSLTTGDPVALAAEVADRTHRCAETVVVAPTDPWAAAVAGAVALAVDGPLLLHDPAAADTLDRLTRLDPDTVVAVGAPVTDLDGTEVITVVAAPATPALPADAPPPAGSPPEPEPEPGAEPSAPPVPTESALGLAVVDHLGATVALAVPLDDVEARAAVAAHLSAGEAVLPVPTTPEGLAAVAALLPGPLRVSVLATDPAVARGVADGLTAAGTASAPVTAPLWPPGPAHTAWLVDPAQGAAAAVVSSAAAARGDTVLPIDATDLRAGRQRTTRIRTSDPAQVVLAGALTPHAEWQLPVVLDGPALPGGGFRLFEGERMVALYGHPSYPALGALGEQPLDATVERTRQLAAPYGADGATVLPTFEIIATVASAEAGDLGDYSRRTTVEELRPHVERAAAEGFYVVLDLQPGRTDFGTQARQYEELLTLPHVGLALDPEWRLGPDQRHLRQVGSVSAAEVQQVADWLAELTRRHLLPQKLLVLHQFRLSMLPDRDAIVAPPELALVVHMDGQGPIGSKDGTYRAITQGSADRWLWGWKNFFDEDVPTPDATHVLGLDPRPVFVSYQ